MVELEAASLFRTLPPAEWRELNKIAEPRQSSAGQEIFREGDPGDGIYVVREGLVEISALVADNQRRVLSQRGPGEIFGEMAVIEDRPRSATAIAAKDSQFYFFPRAEMLALLQHSPGLSFNILQEVSHRLREFDRLHLQEVVQAERLAVLGNFARGIIHDLKTPLTIIGLSAEIVCAENATPEKRAQAHERIRKQVYRINEMVSDILEFTRHNQSKTARKPVNYSQFIAEILSELRAEVEAKSCKLELENQPPAANVNLDSRRLLRVFVNLLHNATDFMPEGKIFLRFIANEKEIITEVEDTGPGIAPQIAETLFQPFVTHGKSHGTGLGLSICKKTIEEHGGKIWTRVEPKHGAIFCFSLPVAK